MCSNSIHYAKTIVKKFGTGKIQTVRCKDLQRLHINIASRRADMELIY